MNRAPSAGALKQIKDVEPPITKETWQNDAYSFSEAIGELGYALNLKANALGECRLRPEIRVPGTDEWVETDDVRVLRVLNAFKPPQGDQGELLRQAALHYEIAGETYLFGAPVKDEYDRPLGLLWEFLSTLECRIESNGKVIRNAWGGSRGREEAEVDAYVARLHHRDPRFSERADCPVRRILPICRELVLLTQVIDAVAKSRLPAGLLFMPWEISPASQGPMNEWEDPGNPDSGADPVEEELAFHLNSPMEDRSAASTLHPFLLRGPAFINGTPTKDTIGLIDLSRPMDNLYRELREETLGRLGGGLDIPPEIMKGKASLSGLGGGNVAASIDADFIAKHVVPLGRTITAFLTTSYLRPMLVTFEKMEPGEADWFRIVLDPTPLSAAVDRSQNATKGVELGIISDEAWARHNGLDEKDLASTALRKRRLLERMVLSNPGLAPNILPILFPNDPEITKALENWNPGGDTGNGPAGDAQPSVSADIPPLSAQLVDLPPEVVSALLAAAHVSVDRALEKAANRLISRLGGIDKAQADRLRQEKRTEVLTIAGTEAAQRCGLNTGDLFHGCWDQLAVEVVEWLRNALVERGADPYEAGQVSEVAAIELATQLTNLCSTALQHRLKAGANGFKVPNELVISALTAGDLARKGSG